MIKLLFTILAKNYFKRIQYVLINMLGMGVALACVIVAFLNHYHNETYDLHHRHADEIYRLNIKSTTSDDVIHSGEVEYPLTTKIEEISAVETSTLYLKRSGSARKEDQYFDFRIGYSDEQFFNVFDLPVIHGSVKSLEDPAQMLLTREYSLKFFGKENSLGETITFLDRGEMKSYIVGGILADLPSNSSFRFDGISNLSGNFDFHSGDWSQLMTIFVQIKDVDELPQILEQIQGYSDQFNTEFDPAYKSEYYFDPLVGMANRAFDLDVHGPLKEALPLAATLVPGLLALMILVLASFTFIQTTIAASSHRMKEIGIRSVMGSSRKQLIVHLIIENVVLCFLSLLIAIPIGNVLLQEFNALLPMLYLELLITNHLHFFIFLASMTCLIGVLSGLYPSFYISSFSTAHILKGTIKYGKVGRLSKLLLIAQFGLSMFAIMTCLFFVKNARFQDEYDLGFDTNETVVIRFTRGLAHYQPLRSALAMNPKIHSITAAKHHVGRNYGVVEISHDEERLRVVDMQVGEQYLDVAEIALYAGRDFDTGRQGDLNAALLVNQTFVKQLGLENPIGERIAVQDSLPYHIIGVLEDFNFDGFESEIEPLIMRMASPDEYKYLIARTHKDNVNSVKEEVILAWETLFQNSEFDIKTGEQSIYGARLMNDIMIKVFSFLGGVAFLLSIIGLYSLVSLNLVSRRKEIGIRRVAGASTFTIMKDINRSYIWIVLIGLLSGLSLGFIGMPALVSSIWAYHVNIGLVFATSLVLVMLVLCTSVVAYNIYQSVKVNPVELLRAE